MTQTLRKTWVKQIPPYLKPRWVLRAWVSVLNSTKPSLSGFYGNTGKPRTVAGNNRKSEYTKEKRSETCETAGDSMSPSAHCDLLGIRENNLFVLRRLSFWWILGTMLDQGLTCFNHLAQSSFLENILVLEKLHFQDKLDKCINSKIFC